MAKPDRTPWEPGIVALRYRDLAEPNPYNGGMITAPEMIVIAPLLGQICYLLDSDISLILRQSKH